MIMQSAVTGPRSEKKRFQVEGQQFPGSARLLGALLCPVLAGGWGLAPPPGARHCGQALALILPQLGG